MSFIADVQTAGTILTLFSTLITALEALQRIMNICVETQLVKREGHSTKVGCLYKNMADRTRPSRPIDIADFYKRIKIWFSSIYSRYQIVDPYLSRREVLPVITAGLVLNDLLSQTLGGQENDISFLDMAGYFST